MYHTCRTLQLEAPATRLLLITHSSRQRTVTGIPGADPELSGSALRNRRVRRKKQCLSVGKISCCGCGAARPIIKCVAGGDLNHAAGQPPLWGNMPMPQGRTKKKKKGTKKKRRGVYKRMAEARQIAAAHTDSHHFNDTSFPIFNPTRSDTIRQWQWHSN